MKKEVFSSHNSKITHMLLALSPPLLIGLAFGFGKIVRDCSLTCNVGYQFFPLAIITIGILSFPLSAASMRFASRLGYRRWQIASLVAISFVFILLWAAAHISVTNFDPSSPGGTSSNLWRAAVKITYILFYVWVGVIGTVIAPNIKGTIYKIFAYENRARILALTGAMIISGGLLGALLANLWAPFIMQSYALRYETSRDTLILAMGIIPLLIIPLIIIIDRKFPGEPYSGKNDVLEGADAPGHPHLPRITLRTAVQHIIQDRKLRGMASLILMTGAAETVVFYLFYWLVSVQTVGEGGRTLFFANFYLWLHASTLFLLVFGTNRLIRRYGLILALLSTPAVLLLGTSYLIFHSALVVMYILRIAFSALEDSIYTQSVDLMILEVSRDHFPLIQRLFHGLARQVGRGLGAVCVGILAVLLHLSFQTIAIFFMLILAVWAGTAISLRPFFKKPAALK